MHSMRTTLVTGMQEHGTEAASVQAVVNHKQLSTTLNHYTQSRTDGTRRAVNSWGDYLMNSTDRNVTRTPTAQFPMNQEISNKA